MVKNRSSTLTSDSEISVITNDLSCIFFVNCHGAMLSWLIVNCELLPTTSFNGDAIIIAGT